MNEGSSRSHAIFTVVIEQKIVKDVDEAAQAEVEKGGKAGEEKAQVTEEISSNALLSNSRLFALSFSAIDSDFRAKWSFSLSTSLSSFSFWSKNTC